MLQGPLPPRGWIDVRRSAAALIAALGIALAGCSASATDSQQAAEGVGGTESASPTPTPEPPPELPRGGREIFPEYRLVGYSGIKGDVNRDLGRLTGDLDKVCKEINRVAEPYARGREILPVFEMITVVVHGTPQADGTYRTRRPKSEVREYLRAARKCKALLLLNIQPGRSEFIPEMKYYEDIISEPDVGVALDPEWAMDPGEIPGVHLGRSDGPELNKSAEYLAKIVADNDLPEKVMVFHQFNLAAVEKIKGLKPHEGVALIRSIDGLGGPAMKVDEYNTLIKGQPKYIHPGFKLFYKEDTNPPWGSRLMTPKEVMKLKPQPEYILYE
jgi:hypothetical protein